MVGHMSNPPNNLGGIVAEAFKDAGLSENEASLLTGISRQTLRRRLAGAPFDVTELANIARILDIPASELMARAERISA
jgi:transcriptional regulator with XRE-family HTH domain